MRIRMMMMMMIKMCRTHNDMIPNNQDDSIT